MNYRYNVAVVVLVATHIVWESDECCLSRRQARTDHAFFRPNAAHFSKHPAFSDSQNHSLCRVKSSPHSHNNTRLSNLCLGGGASPTWLKRITFIGQHPSLLSSFPNPPSR